MNRYTYEELNEVKELYHGCIKIPIIDNESTIPALVPTIRLSVMLKDSFHNLVFNKIEIDKKIREPWLSFYNLIYNIPIEDVPMYLNQYPLLAAWRMKIGK